MDKIKSVLSPGHKDDDELLYGSGEKGIHARGYNNGNLSGQGSHLAGAKGAGVENTTPLDASTSTSADTAAATSTSTYPTTATTNQPSILSEKSAETAPVGSAMTTDTKDTAPLQTTTGPLSSTTTGPTTASTTEDKPHYGRDAGLAAGALGGAGTIGVAASELGRDKPTETQMPTQVEPATTSAYNPTDGSSIASIKSGVPGNPPSSFPATTATPTQGEGILYESTTYTARSYPLGIPSNQGDSTDPVASSTDSSALTGATAATSQRETLGQGGYHSGATGGNVGTTETATPGTLTSTDQHHARDAALVGAGAAASGGLYEGTKLNEDSTGPASKTLGPHSSNVANILDPRVKPDVEKSMSEEKQQERVEKKEAEPQGEVPERKSSTGGMLKGLLAKFGGGKSDATQEEAEDTTKKGEGSHLARDAAVAGGAGAVGAGAYETAKHHDGRETTGTAPAATQSDQYSTPYSSHGVDPRVDGGAANTAATTAATTSATPAQHPVTTTTNTTAGAPLATEPQREHHYGRDAALAGGAGAAGAGVYEAAKHHEARDTTTDPVISQPRTATMPSEVAPVTSTRETAAPATAPGEVEPTATPAHTQPARKEESHKGLETALAGAGVAGAAGTAEHEHEKHRREEAERQLKEQEKEAERRRKEQEKAFEKQQKEHEHERKEAEKAAAKEQKHHEKEVAAAEKAHEKEVKKVEKEHEKHEKELAKEHEKHEKELAKEHERQQKEAEKAEQQRREKEAFGAAAVAGAAGVEHKEHEKQEQRRLEAERQAEQQRREKDAFGTAAVAGAAGVESKEHDKEIMKQLRHNHTEAVKENKEHEKERKAEEKEHEGGSKHGGLLGLFKRDKKPDSSEDLTREEERRHEHHHGRDAAAVGGVGAAATAYGVHEHDKHERAGAAPVTAPGEVEPTSSTGPTTGGITTAGPTTADPYAAGPTTTTTGTTAPATVPGEVEPTAAPTSTHETHHGRDAALVGGAGAAGAYGLHEHNKNRAAEEPIGSHTASGAVEPTATPISTNETHHGRDAALVGGAGAAGAYGLHEHDKNRAIQEPIGSHTAPGAVAPTSTHETHHGRDAALVGGAGAAGAYGLHEHDKNKVTQEPIGSHTTSTEDDHHKKEKGGILGGLLHKDKSADHHGHHATREEEGSTFAPQYDPVKHEKQLEEHERLEHEREKKPSLLDKILHRHKDEDETAAATTGATGAGVGAGAGALAAEEHGDHHNKLHKDPPPGHPAALLKEGEFAQHHDSLPVRVGTDGAIGAGGTHGHHDGATLGDSTSTTGPTGTTTDQGRI